MQLTILGCGSIIQKKSCFKCSGYLIDKQILLDCGPGIWHALCKNKIEIAELDFIILSHFHVDHVSDLVPILMTRWLQINETKNQITICGPEGLKAWYSDLVPLYGDWIKNLPVNLIEVGDEELKIGEYFIKSTKTHHTPNSRCYRLTDRLRKSMFYSGDSDFSHDLINLAAAADLAVIEASNTTQTKIEGHLTPQLAAQLAEEAGSKTLILTHFYPEVFEIDVLAVVRKIYKGKVKLARDNLIIEF